MQNLLSSSLLTKNVKIKIYRIILPLVLYGCETWSLTMREEHRLRVFVNRLLMRIFGAKRDKATREWRKLHNEELNPLTPNDHYSGRTTLLTSSYILYIYSTNIGTEYFKHGIYSSFFPLQNAVRFIILTYLVPVLFTFYIQDVLQLKK